MRHRKKFPLALVVVVGLIGGLAGPAAAETPAVRSSGARLPDWSELDRPAGEVRAAETRSTTDPSGDAADCRGDIVDVGAGYEPSGSGSVAVVAVATACGNDPVNDPAWFQGYSYVAWGIDTNLDGVADFLAVFENDGEGVQAVLLDRNLAPVCSGSTTVQGGGRFLSAGFAGSCLGSPPSFQHQAMMGYDRNPTAEDPDCGACTSDEAPNGSWAPVTALGTPAAKRQGYWMVSANGETFAFGGATHHGNTPAADIVDLEPTPTGNGYWTTDRRGHVFTFGDAIFHGGTGGVALPAGEAITALSSTPTGAGYWLFTNRGRVFSFGDAPFLGDMGGTRLNGPVLDSIPTPSGRGYYMVGSDGGIFTFGDAAFHGSMGDVKLNAPVQSLVPDPDGTGYWLVASDGGIFAFESEFYGSMGSTPLNKPITGMVGFGKGYLMVGEDGGIFTFGEAPFFGSLGDNPPSQPIVSVAILDRS